MKSDIEVIDRAIELVQGGWCQGAFSKSKDVRGLVTARLGDAFCLEGAVRCASGCIDAIVVGYEETEIWDQVYRLERLVATTTGIIGRLCTYNDLPTTTQEDVILALKKTRSVLENR